MNHPITPFAATATSGHAYSAIDGHNDRYYYSVWESTKSFPQTITIDLGEVLDGINLLYYVPKYKPVIVPMTEGSIKKYKLYKSSDFKEFIQIAEGEWDGISKMKVAEFNSVKARYIRLEILSANGNFAAATEIMIGKIK